MEPLSLVPSDDPVLRREAMPIGDYDPQMFDTIGQMLRIMSERPSLGIAAPQVGRSIRIVIVRSDVQGDVLVMVNPEIYMASPVDTPCVESCLSLPGVAVLVRRFIHVKVSYRSLDDMRHDRKFDGLGAQTIQHEIDHLDGKLITDYQKKA